jgi:predicted nucleic acid-binding protein
VIVETSALLAFFDRDEPDHAAVSRILADASEALVLSPYVVAEVDHLVATRHGVPAELKVLKELAGGAWELATIDAADLERASSVVKRHADQGIGIADASIVVLADRYRTRTILTLDRRHFDLLRPLGGGRFTVLP